MTNFKKCVIEDYILNHGENKKSIRFLEKLIDYAENKNMKGDRLAYFISDNFQDFSFGEICIYIEDANISKHAQLEKYKALIQIKRGYNCWLVYYMGHEIIEISDVEIRKLANIKKSLKFSKISYIADVCTDGIYADVEENFKEHPEDKNIKRLLETKAFWRALNIKLTSSFSSYYKIK